MLNELKHKIARWLLSDEVAKLDLERAAFQDISRDYKAGVSNLVAERVQLEKEISNDTARLVRKQLAGFDPITLTDARGAYADDILIVLDEQDEQDAFLAAMKRLHEDKYLWKMVAYLTRDQIIVSATQAKTLEEINFGRATINGFALIREEIDRYTTIYTEKQKEKPTFDEHEVV